MATEAPAEDKSCTDRAVDVFRAFARVPIASRACIAARSGKVEVEVTWTQKDIERGKKVSYNRSYFVEKDAEGGLHKLCTSSCQADVSNV